MALTSAPKQFFKTLCWLTVWLPLCFYLLLGYFRSSYFVLRMCHPDLSLLRCSCHHSSVFWSKLAAIDPFSHSCDMLIQLPDTSIFHGHLCCIFCTSLVQLRVFKRISERFPDLLLYPAFVYEERWVLGLRFPSDDCLLFMHCFFLSSLNVRGFRVRFRLPWSFSESKQFCCATIKRSRMSSSFNARLPQSVTRRWRLVMKLSTASPRFLFSLRTFIDHVSFTD